MKKRVLATLIVAAMIAILLPLTSANAATNANWANVGNAGFSVAGIRDISLAFDNNGTPYVAYTDYGNSSKATVAKFNGVDWEYVGNAGFSDDEAYYLSLAFDNNGIPYVAYEDHGNSRKATVMKWSGEDWETVGNAGFSADQALRTSLGFDNNGIPYVAYMDYGYSFKVTVMKWGGENWETVGDAGFSDDVTSDISLQIDNNGTPYVAYLDSAYNGKMIVKKLGGSSWETVGNAGFSNIASDISLQIDNNGTPYVAYKDSGNSNKATVMKFSGTNWVTVGNAGFSADVATDLSLAIDNNNIPYVAYTDIRNNYKATVMKWGGTSWETVGNAGFSTSMASLISLAINNSGTPYVAFVDYGNSDKATVMKLNIPPTNINLDNNNILENKPVSTIVGTLSAVDINNNDNHTYSFVSGAGDTSNTSFVIDGNQLKSAEIFDYETEHNYSIRVKATDIGGLEVERIFNINVQDIDENPPVTRQVIFYSQGGSLVNSLTVNSGDFATKPTDPTKTSFTFGGWHTDSSCADENRWSFKTSQVTSDTTLYAKWNSILAIDTPNLLSAIIGESYSCTVSASGGDGSYSWYATDLPSGLSIARDSGEISGTPNKTGTFSVKVRVYDGENKRAEKTYTLDVSSSSEKGKYEIVPDADSAYTVSKVDGFTTLTINKDVSGFRYIKVRIDPVTTHEGEETVVFVQMRDNVQIGFCTSTQDFDIMYNASVGFNVKYGDLIKIYIVDCISNNPNTNPTLLQ